MRIVIVITSTHRHEGWRYHKWECSITDAFTAAYHSLLLVYRYVQCTWTPGSQSDVLDELRFDCVSRAVCRYDLRSHREHRHLLGRHNAKLGSRKLQKPKFDLEGDDDSDAEEEDDDEEVNERQAPK